MRSESQNTEYKQTWHDEYLKWICGFANAQGGTIYIGVDDEGNVCGIPNAKKLMEDIPNKVRDIMGIVVDVNLYEQNGLEYIGIVTAPYPYPVSFKGQYHYRSGSTKQELKGAALDRFMLRKQGKTWDGVPVPYVKAEDLDNASFELFRRYAKHSGRMDETDLKEDNATLLDKLRLTDGAYLKRAAVLTFFSDPEKYITGAYVKIGFFRKHANLIYQDEIHGSLFQQVKGTLEVLKTKYLKALISYKEIQRIESLPMPIEALREAILNAIVHKTYESLTPIQIAVYDNKLEIFNCGCLPEGWTINNLLQSHRSRPYNPDIANVFFRAGEIEAWGRGIQRIIEACETAGTPKPIFEYRSGEMWTIFPYSEEYQKGIAVIENAIENATENVIENKNVIENVIENSNATENATEKRKSTQMILNLISKNPSISSSEMATIIGIDVRNIARNIDKLKKRGIIRRVGPDKGGYWEILK